MDFQTPQQRLDALLKAMEPSIRRAFLELIQRQAGAVNMAALIDALEWAKSTRDYSRAVALLEMNQALTFPFREAWRAVFLAGGQASATGSPANISAHFGFGMNPQAAAQVEKITGDLIANIDAEQRTTTRALIVQAVNEGVPARKLAYDMVGKKDANGIRQGGYIGLDGPRAAQATKVSAMLRDPQAIRDYFIGGKIVDGKFVGGTPRFTTTDRRFDKRVRDAIASGKALSKEDADKITDLHRAKLLKNRADTIARNETLNALRAGRHAEFQQFIDAKGIPESRVIRTWLSAKDTRVRDDHVLMNGVNMNGMTQPFTFPDGTQALFPGDTSRGASTKETILCRCVVTYTLRRPGQ